MQSFTQEQALAIMGFTGIATCNFGDFHQGVETRLKRSVWTHEFADPAVMAEIKEAYRADFIAMCLS